MATNEENHDEVVTEQEFDKARSTLHTTFGGKTQKTEIKEETYGRTLKLMENHFVNFDLLIRHYQSEILQWIGKEKAKNLAKRMIVRGNKLNVNELKKVICGKSDIVIIITTTDGDIFGCYESRKIPMSLPNAKVYSKGIVGKHFVFSLSNPRETSFCVSRKSRNGIFNDKPFVGIPGNRDYSDMFLDLKNFCFISSTGGGALHTDTYEKMYNYDQYGQLEDFMQNNVFCVSCIGVYQVI